MAKAAELFDEDATTITQTIGNHTAIIQWECDPLDGFNGYHGYLEYQGQPIWEMLNAIELEDLEKAFNKRLILDPDEWIVAD